MLGMAVSMGTCSVLEAWERFSEEAAWAVRFNRFIERRGEGPEAELVLTQEEDLQQVAEVFKFTPLKPTNQAPLLLKWRDLVTFVLAAIWEDHLYLPEEDCNLSLAWRLLWDTKDKWKQLMARMYELMVNENNVCFLE